MSGHWDRNGTGDWHPEPHAVCPLYPERRHHGRPTDPYEGPGGDYRCGTCSQPVARFTNAKRAAWRHLP